MTPLAWAIVGVGHTLTAFMLLAIIWIQSHRIDDVDKRVDYTNDNIRNVNSRVYELESEVRELKWETKRLEAEKVHLKRQLDDLREPSFAR